ncbi:MAG: 50S ribosomal protein L4 [Saprospiraceae bacterium]|nr:50S ribosomal protein L4 [Saprospiraceae bacterium]
MKLDVLNIEGGKTGRSVELSDDVFGIEPNEHAVYLAVKQYNAQQRQGTSKTKERGEITGSRRKIKRQKGTGTARAGDIKNPIFRGGGRIFGPRPRNYGFKLNKKVKQLARKSVLSAKATDGQIVILEDFTFDQPKTSEFVGVINNLELGGEKVLFVTAEPDQILHLSARNLQKSKVVEARNLNAYDLLNAGKIVLSESAVGTIDQVLGKQ